MHLSVRERSTPVQNGAALADPGSPLEARLAESLGDVLGMERASDEMTLARADRKHLADMLLRSLAHKAKGQVLLAPADVYRIVPRRTWVRRKAEGGLTGAEFDGLYRLVRLQLLASLVFQDSRRASEWLHSPKSRLGGAAPMDFAADSLGYEAVESWLHEIDQGFFA
jgi:putative toxin-antitoxin system antitoxin component (TIGR02293 family)